MKKLIGLLTSFLLIVQPLYALQFASVDEFKGLNRSSEDSKIALGEHPKFDGAYVNDGNIKVLKGRVRLNDTAHTDAVVNGFTYYESSSGTKKLIVRESDELVSYDTDGTNRTSLVGSLANEKADFIQIGDTLYTTSTTNGLYKWSGSGSASAVSGVSAPSSVDFSAGTISGGLTPGTAALGACCPNSALDSAKDGSGFELDIEHDDNACSTCGTWTNAGKSDCVSISLSTTSTYKYKVTKYSSLWGIESEASSDDSVSLAGERNMYFSCSTTVDDLVIVEGGAQTSTTGTLASAPSAPFDGYRIYRTVASGSDYFLLGYQTTGAYTDGKPDIALGTPLDTTIDTINPPSYRYVDSYKGSLFLAEGNSINFTRLPVDAIGGADTYWLASDKINLSSGSAITGLKSTANSLLIFTVSSIAELTGYGISSFRLRDLAQGIGAASDETIEVDNNGDVFFFAGTQGVYKIRTSEQRADELTGTLIDQNNSKIVRISTPNMENVFNGTDSQIVLSPSDYSASHAYFDTDNDLYFLYIGNHVFIYDNRDNTWSHSDASKFSYSTYRKSTSAANQGVLIDSMGYFWNNWTTYAAGGLTGTITGSPTGSTDTTLTDSGATFNTTDDGLKGTWVTVDCAGVLQHRRISANTATQLTVDTAWTSNPTTVCTYYVGYITFDILSKQLSISKPPKEIDVEAVSLVHNLSDSAQNVTMSIYRNKSITAEDSKAIDLSSKKVDKVGLSTRGYWAQLGIRGFVHNTSSTANPPIDIINYTIQTTEFGEG